MALFVHLFFAFGSIGQTTYNFFRPSRTGLRVSVALVALTLATGFILVFMNPAHIASVCVTGLVYVGGVSYGIVAARGKLVRAQIQK